MSRAEILDALKRGLITLTHAVHLLKGLEYQKYPHHVVHNV